MFENFTQLDADTQHIIETFGEIKMIECKDPEEQKQSIEDTLAQRGNIYGEFDSHALITQNIKRAMYASKNWRLMSDDKKECLEMVAHKIGRILNGDPEYKDSWHDIIGYVKLVDNTLEEQKS